MLVDRWTHWKEKCMLVQDILNFYVHMPIDGYNAFGSVVESKRSSLLVLEREDVW